MIRTFFLVSLGRFFSGAVSLESALTMMKSAFTVWNPEIFTDGTLLSFGLGRKDYLLVFILTLFIFAVGIYQERGGRVRETMSKQKLPLRWAFYLGSHSDSGTLRPLRPRLFRRRIRLPTVLSTSSDIGN